MKHQGIALASLLLGALAGACGEAGGASPPVSAGSAAVAAAGATTTTTTTTLRPILYIEQDANGAFIRVAEQNWDAFAPGTARRTIANRSVGPAAGTSFVLTGTDTVQVDGFSATQMKYGMQLMGTPRISVRGFRFTQVDGGGQKYGGALKFGNNSRPTTGPAFFHRVFADGKQAPDGSYDLRNTDFIGSERGNAALYFRDVTGRNFGDAAIDTKSAKMYVMNATVQSAHRMIRVWSGAELVLVNAIVNSAPGRTQVWIQNEQATLKYYNVLWCEGADVPSPSHPKCRRTPWLIEGSDISKEKAAQRIIALSSNPLPALSPFFRTQIDRIDIQYSRNGGTWRTLTLPNTGGVGAPPVGDLRWKIPLNLGDGEYRFRAFYGAGGRQVGQVSLVVNEAGAVVR